MATLARIAILTFPVLLVGALLSGCGAGAKTASTTATSAAGSRQGSAAPVAASSGSHPPRAGARSFIEPKGDNSIPTFGREASPAERADAEVALRSFLLARAKGDWAVACAQLATVVRREMGALARASKESAKGCVGMLSTLSAASPSTSRANPLRGSLLALRVNRDHGFGLFLGPHHKRYVMPMAREGHRWRLTQTAPIPYPTG
jgi:hypothetical protein